MKTHSKPQENSPNHAQAGVYLLGAKPGLLRGRLTGIGKLFALLSLCTFVFGLLFSAIELGCDAPIAQRVSQQVVLGSQASHAEHCISHQEPLSEFDAVQSNAGAIDGKRVIKKAIAGLIAQSFLFDFKTTSSRAQNILFASFPPATGPSIYKKLGHFLI